MSEIDDTVTAGPVMGNGLLRKYLFQKYTVQGVGQERSVEVARKGGSFVTRTSSGEVALAWEALPGGRVLLRIEGRPYEARVNRTHDGALQVEFRGRNVRVLVEDDLATRARRSHRHHGGAVSLRSPMPGTVLKVMVEVGETVSLEQPMLIIEAMKMQNELASPVAGTVVKVAVEPGQAVDADQLLLEIQP